MRGPRVLKDPALLRGHRSGRDLVPLGVPSESAPRCPTGLLTETRRYWRELWGSRVASAWDRASDLPAVSRYIRLLDRWLRYDALVGQTPLVRGSKDQVRPNPLSARMDAVEGQVRALEEQLGLTPAARMRLGISLVSLNRDARRNDLSAVSPPYPDPRAILRQYAEPVIVVEQQTVTMEVK